MEPGTSANPRAQENFKHKNRLQEFAQRASIPLPVYQTWNEGPQHLPQFRSFVIIEGTKFVSPSVFVKRREAEQCVAKLALESVLAKVKQEGISMIPNDTLLWKAILHEYAAKINRERPTYTTSKLEGPFPTFTTSVVFDQKTYKGGPGRSKKDAEQFGARTVVEWILGKSDMTTVMAEIIKSKGKLLDASNKGSGSFVPQDNNMPLKVTLDYHPGYTTPSEHGMHVLPTNGNLPVPAEHNCIVPRIENPKEKTAQKNKQLEGSPSGSLNHVTNDFCPSQVTIIKIEILSDDEATPSDHMQNLNLNNSGKRSRKKNKGDSSAKKMRALPQEGQMK